MDTQTILSFTPERIIELMLAPAIMISACGLLLLGINNKYSIVVNRIRLLNQESRSIRKKIGSKEYSSDEDIRLEVIAKQIPRLMYRLKLVRNAVISYALAVALFVITSLLLGITYLTEVPGFNSIIMTAFLLGMVSVLVGIVFMGRETFKGYAIVEFEVEAEQ
jgi:hypothetical protein